MVDGQRLQANMSAGQRQRLQNPHRQSLNKIGRGDPPCARSRKNAHFCLRKLATSAHDGRGWGEPMAAGGERRWPRVGPVQASNCGGQISTGAGLLSSWRAGFGRSVVPTPHPRRRWRRQWVLLPLALAEDCAAFRGRGFSCPERPPPWRGRGLVHPARRGAPRSQASGWLRADHDRGEDPLSIRARASLISVVAA
jgi:hypothetical protein